MQGQQDLGQSLERADDGAAGEPLQPRSPGASAPPDARSLGKYQLIASLGRGGMAEVVLALVSGSAGFNKLTVLKILREDLQSGSADAVQLFIAEARLAARFCHPNVVRTHEAAEIDGRFLLAMEYLEGQAYRRVQRRAAKTCGLLLHEHLHILSQLARGLHYVHTLSDLDGVPLSMVHRDVSPQNVFVTYDGEVKLLDFGIAQTRDSELPAQSRVIKGKLDYMAPEQLKREPVDARADVFALGAMLWEGISGARFAGGRAVSDFAKAHARVHGGETNIRVVQPDVPKPLAELVDHALALDPAQRLPDARAFADAIDAYLAAVGAAPLGHSLPMLMSSLFERERSKLRVLIERHLQWAKSAQLEAEENTGERDCFRVAEVETSGWTAVRDLGGGSGFHPTLQAHGGADDARTATHSDEHAPVGTDVDEPTHPRARMFTPVSKSSAPLSKRSKVGPALLVALGALSGGVLAWFGPASGSDSRAAMPETGVLSEVRSRGEEARGAYAEALTAVRSSAGGAGAAQAGTLVAEPVGALVVELAGARVAEPLGAMVAEPASAPLVAPMGAPGFEPISAPLAEPPVIDGALESDELSDGELLRAHNTDGVTVGLASSQVDGVAGSVDPTGQALGPATATGTRADARPAIRRAVSVPVQRVAGVSARVGATRSAQRARAHPDAQLAVPVEWRVAKRALPAPLARAGAAPFDPRTRVATAAGLALPSLDKLVVERNPYLR